MEKFAPISIDVAQGKLPHKNKGLEMVECSSMEETRRDQLERLTAGFRLFSILAMMKVWLVISPLEILNTRIIFGLTH